MDFPPLDGLFKAAGCLIVVFVPLGLWKLVEIVVWLFHHVRTR